MFNSSSSESMADALAAEVELLAPGAKLPPQRQLVQRFGASASTVARALAILAQRGLVESRPGAGTYRSQATATPVTASGNTSWQDAAIGLNAGLEGNISPHRFYYSPGLTNAMSSPGPDVIDLNNGYPHPNLQPLASLGSALARAARRTEAWVKPPANGLPALRDWFARDIGGGLGSDNVLISSAGQGALGTVLRALTQPGDPIIVETPTYHGLVAAARAAGLVPITVPVDSEGMQPEFLEEALARTRARVVVVQPLLHNPTAASMSAARIRRIKDIARSHNAFIVEDDYARHMQHDDASPAPAPMIQDDPDGTVIHIRSLSKITSPNLRVGAIAARGPVMARLRLAQMIDNMLISAPLQYTALEVVTASGFRKDIAELGRNLGERRRVAVSLLKDAFGADSLALQPRGGYHLWIRLPQMAESSAFTQRALAAGVAVAPGDHFIPSDATTPHIRISYAAVPDAADLANGIRKLGEVQRQWQD